MCVVDVHCVGGILIGVIIAEICCIHCMDVPGQTLGFVLGMLPREIDFGFLGRNFFGTVRSTISAA